MIDVLNAFCESFFGLGCLGGLMFLNRYMYQHPKDWLMWILIVLTFLFSIAAAIKVYLGV